MKTSIHEYMKAGIVHFMAFPGSAGAGAQAEESLRSIIERGFFDAVEITWIQGEEERKRVKDLLKKSGMDVVYSAQPIILANGLDLNSLDNSERRKALTVLKEHIEIAAYLGAGSFAVLSGRDPFEGMRQRAKEVLVDSIIELCESASSKGNMRIVLETFDRDVDKKALIGPSREAGEISLAVKKECDNFGVMLDLSHLPLQNEGAKEAIGSLGDSLVHAHIGNCVLKDINHPLYGDKHPRFCIGGGENGIEEVSLFLSELLRAGFFRKDNPPILSIEVKPLPGESPEVLVSENINILQDAWQRAITEYNSRGN